MSTFLEPKCIRNNIILILYGGSCCNLNLIFSWTSLDRGNAITMNNHSMSRVIFLTLFSRNGWLFFKRFIGIQKSTKNYYKCILHEYSSYNIAAYTT